VHKNLSRPLSRRSSRTHHDALNRRPPSLLLAILLAISLGLGSAAHAELSLLLPIPQRANPSSLPSIAACSRILPFLPRPLRAKILPQSSCSRPRLFQFISGARETKVCSSSHPSSSHLSSSALFISVSFIARDVIQRSEIHLSLVMMSRRTKREMAPPPELLG